MVFTILSLSPKPLKSFWAQINYAQLTRLRAIIIGFLTKNGYLCEFYYY